MAFNRPCQTLEDFTVHSSSSQRVGGHVTFAARRFTQVQTIDVNAGELLLRANDGCPEYSFGGGVDTGTFLHMVNSLGVELSLRVRRVNSDPSCPVLADKDVTIPAKQFWDLKVPTCGNYTATIFARLASAPGALKLCGPSITTFVAPDIQSDVASGGQFNVSLAEFHDQLNKSNAAFSVITLGYLLQAVQYFVANPGAGIANFTAGNGNFSAFFATLTANAGGITITNDQFYQAFLNITTTRQEIKADLDASQAAAAASLQNLSDSITVVADLIPPVQASLVTLVAKNDAFQAESERFKADLAKKGTDIGGSGCGVKDFFFDGMICYLVEAAKILLYVALGLLIAYGIYWGVKKYQANKKKEDEAAEAKRNARIAQGLPPEAKSTTGRPKYRIINGQRVKITKKKKKKVVVPIEDVEEIELSDIGDGGGGDDDDVGEGDRLVSGRESIV
jgi:hypothetical protein